MSRRCFAIVFVVEFVVIITGLVKDSGYRGVWFLGFEARSLRERFRRVHEVVVV
jgi:hypothetical protein